MRTIGELYDALVSIKKAESQVQHSLERIERVNPVNTHKAVRAWEDNKEHLARLRNTLLDPPPEKTLWDLQREEIDRKMAEEAAHTDYRE